MSDAAVLDPPPIPATGDEPSPPAIVRSRVRLFALALAAVASAFAWYGSERGLDRTRAPGAFALAAAWGFAATLRLARTRRGLATGAAATDAVVAALATALVATGHPWLPSAELRPTWIPIFGPLAALGLLDALVRWRRLGGGEVAAIRGVAAFVAAGAFVVAWQPVPATVALVLGASPFAVLLPKTAKAVRRGIEALAAASTAALFLAPSAARLLGGVPDTGEPPTIWAFLFSWVFAFAAFAASAVGVFQPEPERAS